MKVQIHPKEWFLSQVQRTLKRISFDNPTQTKRVSYVFVENPKAAEHFFNMQSDVLFFEENQPLE